MWRRLTDWLDARSGYRAALARALNGGVHGGSRWGHVFGGVLLALFGLEAITGVGLAAYYAPSTTDAWASVHFIQSQVALGWLMRGLHHYGASAMVIVAGLHLLQTLFAGAYRSPRELTWISGVLLLLLLLLVSHLGYLLPGDLHAYWATQVLLGIAGNQPLVGDTAQALLQGGPEYGNLTLTRLYAGHVLLAPAAFVALSLLHLALRRRHGASAPGRLTEAEAVARTQPYAPYQLVRDSFAIAAVLGGLLAWVVYRQGVELNAPGDPSVEYLARPEWYLRPIFQLRHYFPPHLEFLATGVLPGAALGLLMLLPFVEARLRRWVPRTHPIIVAGVLMGVAATFALGGLSAYADATDPEAQRLARKARGLAEQAQQLAAAGVPLTGPLELYQNDPELWGKRVYRAQCISCHHPCSNQPYEGDPCLEGFGTRTWLTKLLRDPASPYFFGNSQIDEMEPYQGDEAATRALVEFVYSQGDRPDVNVPLAEQGRALYASEGCESCHSLDGKGTGDAPDLKGYGSKEWLSAFIRTPGASRFYGALNKMDDFPHEKLSAAELAAVVAYLRSQPDSAAKFP